MAGHSSQKKHRPEERGPSVPDQRPSPESLENFLRDEIEKERFMRQKIFNGKNGEMINADQVLKGL
jgi:hypothetical protein